MHSTVITSTTDFMNPVQVNVETLITNGLPNFRINGMQYKSAAQTSERIRSAIRASSFKFPRSKVRANLSPLDINKKGTNFDLPIALSILQAYGVINKAINIVAYGELNFKGDIVPTKGII